MAANVVLTEERDVSAAPSATATWWSASSRLSCTITRIHMSTTYNLHKRILFKLTKSQSKFTILNTLHIHLVGQQVKVPSKNDVY